MDQHVGIRIICHIQYCYVIRLKFGDKALTSLTKLVVEVKVSVCSKIKENLALYCRKFSAFVVALI